MTRRKTDELNGRITFRPMQLHDVAVVAEIDRVSFPTPWSETTYRQELRTNIAAYLYVAVDSAMAELDSQIVGYIGFWFIADEAHISTIAVHPDRRRQGLGRLILDYALDQARTLGAHLVTLEVRESNQAAIHLYEQFGFEVRGRRPGYYRDTDEDALIMFKDGLDLYEHGTREKTSEC